MRRKKMLCGFLAGVLACISVFAGNVQANAAGGEESADSITPIYSNDFEGAFDGEALVTGLGAYQGEIAYGDGFSGRAVRLGDYGLKLKQQNIGNSYTISLWIKADSTIADHTPVLFLGYHSPEHWVSISGSPTASKYKIWLKADPAGLSHTTFAEQVDAAPGRWEKLTVSSDGETFSVYQDGKRVARYADAAGKAAASALSGGNQSIYLGVNFWNWEFAGLVDNVRVYDTALTDSQVLDAYTQDLKDLFREDGVLVNEVLGTKNPSVDEVKYDLYLPEKIMELPVAWSSSDTKILDDSGKIYNGDRDQNVVLTGVSHVNGESIEVRIPITVKALDKSGLEAAMAEAQKYEGKYYTEESMQNLQRALKAAENVNRQSSAAQAAARIENAIKGLEFSELYRNPWAVLEKAAPKKEVTVSKNKTVKIYTVPEQIKGMAEVTYLTGDPSVASFANGTVKGIKPGKAIVTVSVTSKYDGWRMEYSSVITVRESKEDGQTGKKGSISGKSSVKAGKKIQLKVKGIAGTVKWSVDKGKLASINSKGVLKGKKKGKVTVKAKVGGVTLKKTVTVKK